MDKLTQEKDLFLQQLQNLYDQMQVKYIEREQKRIVQKQHRYQQKIYGVLFGVALSLLWLILLLRIYIWQQSVALLH
ncbi:hypothetical protein [Candidatus Uabimicrobium amorphum]|uniref:Uncharacterized protein n=1 Tax=Uabimicrobium amorphum TaxID=2596890 RepID=A0A5S9IRL6_UABAM|nr:hypothetical protein [Candidatus Uabimicrobium amorphum]BBM86447.1 hypothetical protein UABAM_04833 [Candidatus Uabimicrobium amorphum]